MSERFETILAQNARLAQVLRAIGGPAYFTAPAYEFQNVAAQLDLTAPLTDASAQRKLQDYADEKDAEDARDALATRADFMRDRRLTE